MSNRSIFTLAAIVVFTVCFFGFIIHKVFFRYKPHFVNDNRFNTGRYYRVNDSIIIYNVKERVTGKNFDKFVLAKHYKENTDSLVVEDIVFTFESNSGDFHSAKNHLLYKYEKIKNNCNWGYND